MKLTIPTVIDQYRLVRMLGGGGTGIVYEAEDMSLGRRVAIKLISREANTPRILHEARFASELRHPRIVRLFGIGAYSDGAYLVLELVEGRSLQSLLHDGPLPWREATAMVAAACDGVMALHGHGIVHRDIKPANLLRSDDGAVKLTDFGLASWLRPSEKSGAGNRWAGTPHYMSPEQCRGEECDERTDIYSLGATYHTLLTGCTPYADAAPLRIMFEHCSAPAPDPRTIRRDIPDACAEIVMRALAKKRADRFDCIREMLFALGRVVNRRSKACRHCDNQARGWLSSRRTGR